MNYPPAEDYDLWERLSGCYKITNIPKFLTYYRIHDNQTSKINVLNQKSSVWNIQERQLKKMHVLPSNEEKQMHQKIGGWKFEASNDFILFANEWLLKLQKANSKTHFYPEPQFTRVLAERWFFICRAAAGLGLNTWSIYWNSPLRKHSIFYKHVYILAKSLIA
ncbi:hypothetical protein [Methanococcoides sp. LMO-2]|uniref:Uncharacterized protein n=1 Tax=Methanococcoides cohabitans TaxID=3136559 RepID=A0ABU9KW72_9EURY